MHKIKLKAINKRIAIEDPRLEDLIFMQWYIAHHTGRRKLPPRRQVVRTKLRIANHPIYIDRGLYNDGSLGEIFCALHKEGSFVKSLLNSFCVSISLGLQYGVPLEIYVKNFVGTTFEPNGFVIGHPTIKNCSSLLDLIFQELALEHIEGYTVQSNNKPPI